MTSSSSPRKPDATSSPPSDAMADVRGKAEGQAAIMLIESVLLVLLDRSILSKADVLETIEIVIETKQNIAKDGQSVEVENMAAGLLKTLANSLMASSPVKRPERTS